MNLANNKLTYNTNEKNNLHEELKDSGLQILNQIATCYFEKEDIDWVNLGARQSDDNIECCMPAMHPLHTIAISIFPYIIVHFLSYMNLIRGRGLHVCVCIYSFFVIIHVRRVS